MDTTKEAHPEIIDAETTQPEEVVLTRQEQAEKLSKSHILWSMGCGLIPVPLVDLAGIMAVQVRLVAKMSEIYGVSYSEHRVKNIVAPLVTSVGVVPIGAGIMGSLVKSIPLVGTLVGVASMPVVAGATTYAISKVFTSHFEAGGTLLDFNPQKMKAFYAEMFDEGKKVAQDLKAKQDPSSTEKKR